ncbi:MAG TPA: MarR family winged helix-turn-helix transcriptional regulator [Methylomirabilota bacterium]|nr:MarR family winged helix-turn-helix transcriptional regulator [Methylomirabilota bacterium]
MADINFARRSTPTDDTAPPAPDPRRSRTDPSIDFELIELLFFAYRDFIGEADQTLATYGFGRAHHRVLHFVNRNPGMPVSDLLETLRITKQSLGRVLKQLVDEGFVEQTPGPVDRRQRLLTTTARGRALALDLASHQSARISAALAGMDPAARATVRAFLDRMVDRTPYAPGGDMED